MFPGERPELKALACQPSRAPRWIHNPTPERPARTFLKVSQTCSCVHRSNRAGIRFPVVGVVGCGGLSTSPTREAMEIRTDVEVVGSSREPTTPDPLSSWFDSR